MTGSRTILVSMLVLAGATYITCGVLDEFMSRGIMANGKGGGMPFGEAFVPNAGVARNEGVKGGYNRGSEVSGGGAGTKVKGETGYEESRPAGDRQSAGGVKESGEKATAGYKATGEKATGGKILGGKTGGSKENEVEKKSEGFLGCKTPADFLKLALNPIEFVNRVAEHFGLHKGKFLEHISKAVSFVVEIALQPVLVTLKLVEKIFVPDVCKLRFVCKLANPLSFSKSFLPKLSTKFFEGSAIIKAFSDGIQASDCDAVYSGCKSGEPKLKHMFESMGGHSSGDSSRSYPTAINVSDMGGQLLKALQSGQQ